MSEWWWVSTPKMTFAVEVNDGIVVSAAPIAHKFIGQPSVNLGAWLRKQGDVKFERLTDIFVYVWGNNDKRASLKGRPCRIVARGQMRSVLAEFDNGQREVVSYRALRKENTG